ncbi:serine hydrolase domain-containing protein [Bacterioplanes sanyensis]|nr:serine hydrolase [Bacterioplanes sanyensis]
MRVLKHLLLFVLALAMVAAPLIYLSLGRTVVAGYAAKTLCSGLWVSGLPQDWLQQQAIAPALEPLSAWIDYQVDESARQVRASVLGYQRQARFIQGRGCTLLTGDSASLAIEPTVLVGKAQRPLWRHEPHPTPAWLDALLDQAFAEPDDERRQTLAIAIAHQGNLLVERYRAPVQPTTPLLGWSMNKSLLASWVGVQAHRGEIHPDTPANTRFAQLPPELTLRQLLQMTSGLEFREWYQPGDDVTNMLYHQGDMAAFVASRPLRHRSGYHWAYSSGDSNLAMAILQQSMREPLDAWLQRHVWQPLGIVGAVMERDVSGTLVASSYGYMTARQWLRVGQWWLDGWHQRASNLPDHWMQQATTASASNPDQHYGMGFWLNGIKADGNRRFNQLPAEVFWARGHDGQYVMVLPQHELVIARFGLTPGKNDGLEALAAGLIQHLEEKTPL